jgi:hypothetical protein
MFILLAMIVVPILMLYLVRRLDSSAPRHGRLQGLAGWLREVKLWHIAAAIGLTALVFAAFTSRDGEFFFFLLVLGTLALIARAWRHEFLFLMSLRDDELPGRHDKLAWFALLVVLPPVGLWTFRAYREAHWPEPVPEPLQTHSKPVPEAL